MHPSRFRVVSLWLGFLFSGTSGAPAQESARLPAHATKEAFPPQAVLRLGELKMRPRRMCASAIFSPDGKTLVTSEYEIGRVQFWDVATGRLLRELPKETASCVAFRPDGKQFVTGFGYGPLQVWDVGAAMGRKLRDRAGHSVVYSADGKRVLTTLYAEAAPKEQWGSLIALLDLETGAEIRRFSGFENLAQVFLTLAYSPDGRYVAAGNFIGGEGRSSRVVVWDAATGKKLCQVAETWNVHQLAFTLDSESLIIGAHERVRIIDPASGKVLREFPKETRAGVALDPTGKLLLTAGDKSIWDLSTGKRKFQWTDDHLYPGREAAWSADGKTVAVTFLEPPFLALWNAETGKRILFDQGHRTPVDGVAVSTDGRWIATAASKESRVCLWDARDGTFQRALTCDAAGHYPFLEHLRFSQDGATLTVAGTNWDVATGTMHWSKKEKPDSETRLRLFRSFLSPDGATLVSTVASETMLHRWDARTSERLMPKLSVGVESTLRINDSVFSPDGKTLATACVDLTMDSTKPILDSIVFWDARSGKRLRAFRPKRDTIRRLLFTPDGAHLLVSTHPGTLEIWQVSTGLLRHEMSIPWDAREELTVFAIAAHGQLLAVQTKDESIQIWEATTGKLAHTLQGSYTRAKSLAFGHDGRTLISGHADGSALVWDLLARNRPFAGDDEKMMWEILAADPKTAYPRLWALATEPKPALDLLRKHLKPAPPVDDKEIRQWIADLGDAAFRKRENAHNRLVKLGVVTVLVLREELKKPLVLETQRRIEKILSIVDPPSPAPELLRDLRALQLLELIGDAPARELLAHLATGNPQHPLTREAVSALRRVKHRK